MLILLCVAMMNVNLWWLLGGVLLCATVAAIIFRCWRFRIEWRRAQSLAQAEEANRLCRAYCDLILRLKADPFNVSLCQKFLVCAAAYHTGDSSGGITPEVERMIMHDLMLAGVRQSAMFGKLPEPQVSRLGSVPSVS